MESKDPAIEEETVQEQPLIEEPEEGQENQQPTTDPAAEETNPSEEEGARARAAKESNANGFQTTPNVRSSSSVPVLVEGRVLIRNKKSHDLARSGISGLDARSIYASLLVTVKPEL
ncbi:hypothetical protein U9M48_019255 [Paspalum notatum var. saurae]|uniref:Uncharacterized protein n=1 Tax=Paspalum notatum var. saurae TaxID=547442 RepID=A0AAQ3WQK7_PASNO